MASWLLTESLEAAAVNMMSGSTFCQSAWRSVAIEVHSSRISPSCGPRWESGCSQPGVRGRGWRCGRGAATRGGRVLATLQFAAADAAPLVDHRGVLVTRDHAVLDGSRFCRACTNKHGLIRQVTRSSLTILFYLLDMHAKQWCGPPFVILLNS